MATNVSPASGGSPPQSVESITRKAQDYEYNPSIPLRYWLRTAATMMREARIYEREKHDEQAYLLLFRHAQLVLVNLAEHPEAKDEKNRKALVEAEKEVQRNLRVLERLKPRINKRHERYTQLMRERQSRTPLPASNNTSPLTQLQSQPQDPALAGVAEPLEAGENRDLAVQLARTEISRRATVRQAIRQAGISPEEERTRRTAGMWGDWDHSLRKDAPEPADDLSRRIQNVRVNMDGAPQADHRPQIAPKTTVRPSTATSSLSAYKYPTVPRQNPLVAVPSLVRTDPGGKRVPPPKAPAPPPKEISRGSGLDGPSPPPRPDKISPAAPPVETPALPAKVQPATDGPDARSDLDPSSFTFKPSAYLENGTPLRTLFLPPDLRKHFVSLAAPNTQRNLETCAILCGTLISNALFVSRLLIPEQTATSDTCETVNESAIFDYCDSEDLMVLGWIHTHPTQTCFMSSRDLHTHCGYQVMLPESIAIVCAPSKTPDWGIFRLTDPPGLKTVLNCTQSGLFHPHGEANIYTDALRPGHVFEAKGLEFETVDLRPKGSGL
ncbi:putative endosome-associated ubiquitin isopeptidase [Aspergillus heteromorphus CBS 117.55]|uniref:Putative endosome-associated ubiquitin isopeptidase n=1 Tax=Aspergillus heteromorphus CBS 117.55 TaxID=1448321 RepID=A0A317X7D6_9EURO|nr:putative endosome-associated ubiquitin isopeptidase [Aspergillus heteromorphus CBS 117.55]PWY92788.1 putative endosome-associated ubiquitin isopeptidase [Aspergillus heteromorphus CBS 117.55]